MDLSVPTVGHLIAAVDALAADADPLARLTAATAVARELSAHGDALIDHYVEQARQAGLSWAQIGATLNVSKQAVQQRAASRALPTDDSDDSAYLRRFTPRARTALRVAQDRAAELGHTWVGTEHLLLGAIADGEGLAAKVLGPRREEVTGRLAALMPAGSPGGGAGGTLPMTPRARGVLSASTGEALQLGHNYVGTEHMLLAMFREGDGLAGRALVQAGVTYDEIRTAVVAELAAIVASRGGGGAGATS